MAYVFVSHASEDKPRVRPLVKALALEGLNLWLDRPGHGESHFNFKREFIARHGIRELQSGLAWQDQISQALGEASAVLLCISRSFCAQRVVWSQEVLISAHTGKLTACIVDDLEYSEIPKDFGLLDPSRLQAERIDPPVLDRAADEVASGTAPESLPADLLKQWEIVRKLTADVRKVFDRAGVQTATPAEMRAALEALRRFPIDPAVRAFEIPEVLIALYADRFGDAERAKRFVALAMGIRADCNEEGFTRKQILVSAGEVVNPRSAPAEEYWTDVLTTAGMKSRRTLASLLVAPGAPAAGALPAPLGAALREFVTWLELPDG